MSGTRKRQWQIQIDKKMSKLSFRGRISKVPLQREIKTSWMTAIGNWID